MSVEHMRTAQTLERNLQMCYAVERGAKIADLAREWRVKPSSVRSSVVRTKSHVMRFVQTFPSEINGKDPQKRAFQAFAKHVGVAVALRGGNRGGQLNLF